MPRLTKEDVDQMFLLEVQEQLLDSEDKNKAELSLLLDRKQQLLDARRQQALSDKQEPLEIDATRQSKAKQASGLVFVDEMSLVEVQEALLDPEDNKADLSLLLNRKEQILQQVFNGEQEAGAISGDSGKRRKKQPDALRKSQSVEIEATRLPEAKQASGLVFVDQPREEQPLTYGGGGARTSASLAADESAQQAYDRKVQQKKQRAEEVWLDGIRETILSLGETSF